MTTTDPRPTLADLAEVWQERREAYADYCDVTVMAIRWDATERGDGHGHIDVGDALLEVLGQVRALGDAVDVLVREAQHAAPRRRWFSRYRGRGHGNHAP